MTILAAAQSNHTWTLSPGTALLALAAISLYVASRAAADAIAGGRPDRPGFRALGHCLPVAITALLFLTPIISRPNFDQPGGRPQLAVALIFGTCVACITLVLGVVTYIAPVVALPPTRKAWPFILPAALLALVAGFGGQLTWQHAGMLAVLGLAVFNLWVGPDPSQQPNFSTQSIESAPVKTRPTWARVVQFILALALSVVGGWAAVRGVARVEESQRALTAVLMASTVLGPLMTLPILGSTAALAERGRPEAGVSTIVAIVLINLCGVLPAVILSHAALVAFVPKPAPQETITRTTTQPTTQATSQPTTNPDLLDAPDAMTPPAPSSLSIPYPMISWRVDTVLLVVLGFGMIPWAIGRWNMSRIESVVLIFAYAVYLGLAAILSTRYR